jgi:hypothetical protein
VVAAVALGSEDSGHGDRSDSDGRAPVPL